MSRRYVRDSRGRFATTGAATAGKNGNPPPAVRMANASASIEVSMEHIDPMMVYDREREISDDPLKGWRKRTHPLVADIKARGMQRPLTVETDGNLGILSDGNHRAAAAKIIGLGKVPVQFVRVDTRYVTRGGGAPLHPSVKNALKRNPQAIHNSVKRQPSWAQGEKG